MVRKRYTLVLTGIIAASLAAGFWLGRANEPSAQLGVVKEQSDSSRQSGSLNRQGLASDDSSITRKQLQQHSETPTPEYPSPIYTEEDAIARSMEVFPQDHSPSSSVARLIRTQTLDNDWFFVDQSDSEVDPYSPVWLVGILGSDLVVDDAIDSPPLPVEVPEDLRPVDGIFFVWDANSGILFSQGALVDADWRNWTALTSLSNENLLIQPATPRPSETPPYTGTPSP